MNKSSVLLSALLAVTVLFSACDDDDDVELKDAQLNVKFSHVVGGMDPLVQSTIEYENAFGNMYSVETLRYFVSDFLLVDEDGNEVRINEAHYVDAFDTGTHVFQPAEKIPAGKYVSVSFIFGLDEEMNVPGKFPNPPESNMEWPLAMGSGYHYMKLEGKVDSAGTVNNFQAHTGPTMGNQNYIEVTLPGSAFTFGPDGQTLTIFMDINKWWSTPHLINLSQVTGIMGNQAMQEKLKANGQDVFGFGGIE